jgi:protein SCO1
MKLALALVACLLPVAACKEGASDVQPIASSTFKSGVFDPPRVAPDFELDGSDGKKVSLAAHRGKVIILEFGFSTCPKICPVTLSNLVLAHKQLGAAADDVQLIFITVDPKRDDAEKMRTWLAAYHPRFLGATGTPEALEVVRQAYGVIATEAKSEELGYEVHHSSSIYLIDRKGMLRVLIPFGKKPEDIVHDLKVLLDE